MPRTPAPRPTVRSYVSDFRINISAGPLNINTVGRLTKITKTGSDDYRKFTSVCPDCTTPTPVKQQYMCATDPSHVHVMGELDKAKTIGDDLVRVSAEEVLEAKSSDLPDNVFTGSIHNKDELLAGTWDSDNAYVFFPNISDAHYELLVRLVSDSDKAFVSICNLRNNEGLFRLDVWRGHLIVQKIFWPEDCNEIEPGNNECPDIVVNGYASRLEAVPFNPETYRSGVKERLLDLEAALDGDGTAVPARTPAKTSDNGNKWGDLLSALDSFAS